jgi:hypothetical protein
LIKAIFGNLYILEMLQGNSLPRAINKKYFKKIQEFGKYRVLSK